VSELRVTGSLAGPRPVGTGCLPRNLSDPWSLPRRVEHALFAPALHRATARLEDWGYRVRTGQIDASRNRDRLAAEFRPGHVPLLWAESVQPSGLSWPGARRRGVGWFDARGMERFLIRPPALLVQRTSAPEQPRRLVTTPLTEAFVQVHGAVAVENHVNLVEPIEAAPLVSLETLAAFLGSAAADHAFRCIGGGVAVSAYELRSLPLPPAAELAGLASLLAADASAAEVEAECRHLYLRFIEGRATHGNA
jgi:adenine-specific DNA-methyltransferase